jgi:hypothetical protein
LKSKQALQDALRELGRTSWNELDAVVRNKVAQCDDFSIQNIGSSLAAELVALVGGYRKRRAEATVKMTQEKNWQQWLANLETAKQTPNIDWGSWYEKNFFLVPEIHEAEAYQLWDAV